MIITKNNFEILKAVAVKAAGDQLQIIKAINETETAAIEASKKATAYILEKRKQNKNYCR